MSLNSYGILLTNIYSIKGKNHMFLLNKLKDLFIYKNKPIKLDKHEVKGMFYGTLIYNLSLNKDGMDCILNNKLIKSNFIKGYYVPKITNSKTLSSKKRVILPQLEIYKKFKEKETPISFFKIKLSDYALRNTVYDLQPELDEFFKVYDSKSFQMKSELLVSFMNDVFSLEDSNEFQDKIVFIKVNNTSDILQQMLAKEIEDITVFISRMIKTKVLNSSHFQGLTFLFYNNSTNAFIKAKFNTLVEDFKTFIIKIRKLSNNEVDEDIEEALPEPQSDVLKINPESQPKNLISTTTEKPSINLDNIKSTKLLILRNRISDLMGFSKFKDFAKNSNVKEILDKINNKIEEESNLLIDNVGISEEDIDETEIINRLKNDVGFKKHLLDLEQNLHKSVGNEILDQKRASLLKKRSEHFKNVDFDEILNSIERLTPVEITYDKELLHPELKKFKSINRSYNDKLKDSIRLSVLDSFKNDPEVPFILSKLESEDSSSLADKKETYKITFKTLDNEIHNVKIDIPKVVDTNFLMINGNKKIILKQILKLPITKTKQDEVELVTNYNKVIMSRFGSNVSPNSTRFQKLLKDYDNFSKIKEINLKIGNARKKNVAKTYSLEYNEISSKLTNFSTPTFSIFFNYMDTITHINSSNGKYDNIHLEIESNPLLRLIGFYKDGSVLVYNVKTNEVFKASKNLKDMEMISSSLILFLLNSVNEFIKEDLIEKFYNYSLSSKYIYSRVSMLGNKIPTGVIVGYHVGLKKMLELSEIEYEFFDSKQKKDTSLLENYEYFKLKDGYLYYKNKPFEKTLLINGINELDLSNYTFEDLDSKIPYALYIEDSLGSINIVKGIENFMSLILDPITINVLKTLELPYNIDEVLIYMSNLLGTNEFKLSSDFSNYRIRGNEIIEAYLYKILADGIKSYRDKKKSGMKKPKIEIAKDSLMKTLVTSAGVEEYSILNPVLEVEYYGNASLKGLSGVNLNSAYTLSLRAYHESMVGTIGLNHPDSDKAGVVRYLTANPNIKNSMGFINENTKDLNPSDMYTPVELLSSYTGMHSDPPRQTMQAVQTKHLMPTEVQHKPLITTGMHKTLTSIIGDDFADKAKDDGKILDINDELGIMVIQYKNGKKELINLGVNEAKNSGGGFYTTNKKETLFQKGKSFKKGDILAINRSFFSESSLFKDEIFFCTGALAKVAVTSSWGTFEDSCVMSQSLSEDLKSTVTINKSVVVGENTNIDHIVKIGEKIKAGNPLMIWESSFEDESINKVLSKLGSDFDQSIKELSKNVVLSKYSGEIVDIKIIYNTDLDKLSPTLKKLISSHKSKNTIKEQYVKKAFKNASKDELEELYRTNGIFKEYEMLQSSKLDNQEIDGVMIEFFIKTSQTVGIGDKVALGVAVKTIVAEVLPDEKSPYSEYRSEDEKIDIIISPMSPLNRMTGDFFLQLFTNKVLLELKKQIKEILD